MEKSKSEMLSLFRDPFFGVRTLAFLSLSHCQSGGGLISCVSKVKLKGSSSLKCAGGGGTIFRSRESTLV